MLPLLLATEVSSVRIRMGANQSDSPGQSLFDISCYMEEDPAGEEGAAQGRSYRGLATSTISGRQCQKWTAARPWPKAAEFKPEVDRVSKDSTKWGNGIGNHNYCRNPDSSMDSPWCYTQDPQKEKELCEIPKCPKRQRDLEKEATDLATKVQGSDCQCMDQLHGSARTTKKTAVPLAMLAGVAKDGKPCRCSTRRFTRRTFLKHVG